MVHLSLDPCPTTVRWSLEPTLGSESAAAARCANTTWDTHAARHPWYLHAPNFAATAGRSVGLLKPLRSGDALPETVA